VRQEPKDPDFAARVRASFANQVFMSTLGATLERVEPGVVDIALPFDPRLTQQHGFLHAGAIATVADSACGYAALSLMAPGFAVLSVEFKINMLAPASGRLFLATGRVLRAGRTITVCAGEVRADGGEKIIAAMQATMMAVENRPGVRD
jgi:uncharacterized protein (TIGR00369 family)